MNKGHLLLVAALGVTAISSGTLLAQRGMGGRMGGRMGGQMGMRMGPIQAPPDNPITPEKVALGKQLYFDPRLSKDRTVSCNSCHDLAIAGADTKPVSTGVGGARGTRNSPTVWNVAFHDAQFQGRYNVTRHEADRHVYRVPSLRNVEKTAPYFHNGAAATLEEATRVCAKGANDRDLTAAEVADLVAFMRTLTGTFPEQKPPKLP